MAFDATFWATVALVLFLALIAYLKVPGMVTKSLDDRADRIRGELDEARRLREEAQQLLAEYQRKRAEAEKEAGDILAAAEREATMLRQDAKTKADEYVARRTTMAEQKIAQAEREAVNAVRSSAVDIAVEAARRVLAEQGATAPNAFQSSLAEVRTKLN
ncbi:F0F1 ATP synthase subunit B [Tianweitania sediminis]|jgi:F-type H+-transporting ATPase subunit b|uniref:ATP synthase subunit b n=1 Tax=Tianweitania sediminis TaxID=1502156 RepID=A0A8J7RHX5_9HYPH|nr:F0F1 ATP synthase subunit B [Tianweitania sediminis]MBP0438746.1 F0F1 ATP synthase subunit B [Tianweitania sediminis]HEV7417644.1 F0F1 ATP synthase subunit B [Tianweitania sediminis]